VSRFIAVGTVAGIAIAELGPARHGASPLLVGALLGVAGGACYAWLRSRLRSGVS
jgi:hypothetical protein